MKPSALYRRRLPGQARSTFLAIVGAVASCHLAVSDARAGTIDKFQTGSDLTTAGNYQLAPTAASDVRFTTSSSALTLGGGTSGSAGTTLTVESLTTEANSTSFTISNAATAGSSTIILGNTSGFTNANSTVANDLIALTGSANLTIQGANSGSGTGTLGLTLTSSGNFDISGSGTLTISSNITANAALSITGSGPSSISGNIGTAGAFTISGTGTSSLSGSNSFGGGLLVSAGEVDVAGDASLGSMPATATADITINGGRLGSVSGATFVINANRTILLGSTTGTSVSVKGTGTVTYNGTFQDLTSGGILVKQGAGTLNLGGMNTFTGGTTINTGTLNLTATNTLATTSGILVGSATTLSLAANSALATPGASTAVGNGAAGTTATPQVPVTLSGGTLLRNGMGVSAGSGTTVGVGSLTLSAASTLDFGTAGVGTLNFNGFVDTGNVTLSVTDYNRTSSLTSPGVDGTDDRLIFNQDLTMAQVSDISFGGTAAQEFALGNGEYEITPITASVPEPATWTAGLLMAGVLGCNQRRIRRALRA